MRRSPESRRATRTHVDARLAREPWEGLAKAQWLRAEEEGDLLPSSWPLAAERAHNSLDGNPQAGYGSNHHVQSMELVNVDMGALGSDIGPARVHDVRQGTGHEGAVAEVDCQDDPGPTKSGFDGVVEVRPLPTSPRGQYTPEARRNGNRECAEDQELGRVVHRVSSHSPYASPTTPPIAPKASVQGS